MTLLESILLGLVQGLGEFLPISSSAHLVVAPWLFDFKDPGLSFNVALHFGTLLALLIYFYKDWIDILGGVYRVRIQKVEDGTQKKFDKLFWMLFFGTIPGAILGLLLEEFAETIFRNPLLIAFNMVVMGSVLWWADRRSLNAKKPKDLSTMSFKDGLYVGILQGLALIPGVSRSGVTMTTGLFCGLDREASARFSFLLAFPITLGACVLKADDFFKSHLSLIAFVGIFVSFIVGLLAIKYLMTYVRKHGYLPYVIYRYIFGIVVTLLYFMS